MNGLGRKYKSDSPAHDLQLDAENYEWLKRF